MSTYKMTVHGIFCDGEGCAEGRDDGGSGMTYGELRAEYKREGCSGSKARGSWTSARSTPGGEG